MPDHPISLSRRAVLAGLAGSLLPGAAAEAFDVPAVPRLIAEDYAAARQGFHTRLTRRGPSPDDVLPLTPPEGAERIGYRSGALDLTAWVSPRRESSMKRPGVLVLHGGNVLGAGHWDLAAPYAKAGYVAMMPALRGENGQPGVFSAFYDETDDVLAAAETLARRPGVDPQRLFLAGHSIGGTQTMLAALSTKRFRGAAAFSGNPNSFAFFKRFPEEICFDTTDPREFEMRSAICYATSFKCPVRLFHGTQESRLDAPMRITASRAKAAGLDVAAAAVPGDHNSALPGEIARSIAFFAGL